MFSRLTLLLHKVSDVIALLVFKGTLFNIINALWVLSHWWVYEMSCICGVVGKHRHCMDECMNSLVAKCLISIFVNLRYLLLKLLVYQRHCLTMFSLWQIWAASPYILSVSLIRCTNEALKKIAPQNHH